MYKGRAAESEWSTADDKDVDFESNNEAFFFGNQDHDMDFQQDNNDKDEGSGIIALK